MARSHSSKAAACVAGALLLFPARGNCDAHGHDAFGGMLGLSCSFGTLRLRVGLIARGWYAADQFQANAALGIHYNFAGLGPPRAGPEIRGSLGGVFSWGGSAGTSNVFLSPVGNQTGRRNSVGYAYNLYRDRIGTSQRTGTLALQLDSFHLATENDFLAGKGEDRFRTGAISAAVRGDDALFALKTLLWTGDTLGAPKTKDPTYPYRAGYRDMREARWGSYSHGILSAQVSWAWRGYQTVGAEVGVDWERIRHVVQNRFIHDLAFLPEGWVESQNPHIPMRSSEGKPYLFRPDQRVERPAPVAQLELNPPLFY